MKCRVHRPRPCTLRARDAALAAPKSTTNTRVCGSVGPKQTVTVCLKRTGKKPSQTLKNEADVCKYMRGIGNADRESFWVLHLNARHQVIGVEEVAKGHATGVEVHPREVFKGALLNNATAMLIAHNHPSGNPNPSRDDEELTQRLSVVGRQMGIPVLDHVIVASGGKCTSLGRRGVHFGDGEPLDAVQASDVMDLVKPPTMGSKVLEWFLGGLLLSTVGGVLWWKWNQISSSGVPLNYALSRTFSHKFFEGSIDLRRSYLERQGVTPSPQPAQTAGARALPPLFR